MANSHTKAVNKYNAANYDSLRIVVPKGQKEKIRAHAEKRGESINGFVGRAINETLQRDEKSGEDNTAGSKTQSDKQEK